MADQMGDNQSGIEEKKTAAKNVVNGESWSVQSGNFLDLHDIPDLRFLSSIC